MRVADDRTPIIVDEVDVVPLPLRARAMAYVALTKPRIIELLLVTTVPSMILAERGLPSLALILWTLIGGTLGPAERTPSTATSTETSTRSCTARGSVRFPSTGSLRATRFSSASH